MANRSTFTKVAASSQKPMYGPRKLLICGFDDRMQARFDAMLTQTRIRNLPRVFVADLDGDTRVGDLFDLPAGSRQEEAASLPLAVIMSGLSQKEVHLLIGAYRQAGMPRPLWASLTPISEKWSLDRLLSELASERESSETRRRP